MTPTQLEAILAEREACAGIALEYAENAVGDEHYSERLCYQTILAAIQARPTPANEEPPATLAHELVPERYGEPLNDFGADGWTGKPRDLASRQLEAERIAELEAALKQIRDHEAPELNLSNYGPEDVEALNQGWIEVHFIARNALARP